MVFLTLRSMLIVMMAAERAANHFKEAHHDQLTGLLNESGLLHALQGGVPDRMALLLVDLDHFKQSNDADAIGRRHVVLATFIACDRSNSNDNRHIRVTRSS